MENQYVNSLKRRIIKGRSSTRYPKLRLRAVRYLGRTTTSLMTYIGEVIRYRDAFATLAKLRNYRAGGKALVVGNGPSQGYMKAGFLEAFKRTGGEVFVVNFWNQNRNLSMFIPDYLVISDPATLSFSEDVADLHDQNTSLLQYLQCNASIKVICPFTRCKSIGGMIGEGRVIGFTDTELRGITGNISPKYPRGYVTMTLYKALAMALYFGYKAVYVIGLDNTYPRNIYCDEQNRILNLEKHSGVADTVSDQSNVYSGVGPLLKELSVLFLDAKRFARRGIVRNLDRYSLTDAFPKVGFEDAVAPEITNVLPLVHESLCSVQDCISKS